MLNHKILVYLALALSAPLVAMNTNLEQIKNPVNFQKIATVDVLKYFKAIHSKSPSTTDIRTGPIEKTEKDKRLIEKFFAFSDRFFRTKGSLCSVMGSLKTPGKTSKPKDTSPVANFDYAAKILASTLVQLKNYLSSPLTWRKGLDALPIKQKIWMLSYSDYMQAPGNFLNQIAWSIKRDILKDKTLYDKHITDLEACGFQVTCTTWEQVGVSRSEPPKEVEKEEPSKKQVLVDDDLLKRLDNKKLVRLRGSYIICIAPPVHSDSNALEVTVSQNSKIIFSGLFNRDDIFVNEDIILCKPSLLQTGYIVHFKTGAHYPIEKCHSVKILNDRVILYNGPRITIIESSTGGHTTFRTDYNAPNGIKFIGKAKSTTPDTLVVTEMINMLRKCDNGNSGEFVTQYHTFNRKVSHVPFTSWVSNGKEYETKNYVGTLKPTHLETISKCALLLGTSIGGTASLCLALVLPCAFIADICGRGMEKMARGFLSNTWANHIDYSATYLVTLLSLYWPSLGISSPPVYSNIFKYMAKKLDIRN